MHKKNRTTTCDPYLSVVATARNDNHGGRLLERTQMFIEGLISQCDRFSLPAELLLVEWNPPADRPRLVDAINWPYNEGHCRCRVVEVSNEVHRRFQHADSLPLFQMIGKNVGIRRARGEFILATNIDILLSNELMSFIADRRLRADRMYRLDRTDADEHVPLDATVAERLDYCRDHVIRIEARKGTTDMRNGSFHRIYWDLTPRVVLLEWLQDLRLVPTVTRRRLHLNACGDFTMMARDRWLRVRGYPEFEMYSMHLDSVLCTQAHFDGTRECVLRDPMRIYHIEHGAGSGFTPEAVDQLNLRLEKAGVPQLSHDQFHKWAVQMRRERKPMMFNDEDSWGLADEALNESDPYAMHPETRNDREADPGRAASLVA